MTVLHITYERDPDTSDADYQHFCGVLKSYGAVRLSASNWTIHTRQPPKSIWQKLIPYVNPHDYVVILPLDHPSSLSVNDRRVLSWYLLRP
jgi:hypothetical protein